MTAPVQFVGFPKIARFSREIIVTEKIDGTNACIFMDEYGTFLTGSRTRWITPENDNFGFAKWATENKNELLKLGPGRHFGEWWGLGIQRGYGLKEKRFSLFNTIRFTKNPEQLPICCSLVPILYQGLFDQSEIEATIGRLGLRGSLAAPGFMNPEGIIIYHTAGNVCFKKTLKNDEVPKSYLVFDTNEVFGD